MELEIRENIFELLPQRALYWNNEKALIVGDLHLGKIAHFRNEGIPLPRDAMKNNFLKLDELMRMKHLSRMIIVGDLFHSIENEEWDLFMQWRKNYQNVRIDLILGNHDILPENNYTNAGMNIHRKEYLEGRFTFSHKPKKDFLNDEYVIAGHVHPVFKITGKANQRMRLPCFYYTERQLVLPSFGYFTGGFEIRPEENSRVYLIIKNVVEEIIVEY